MREPVRIFAEGMEKKLQRNDYKGGWTKTPVSFLWKRLHEEVEELDEALINHNLEHILSELVDISNFAMMIADRLGVLTGDQIKNNKFLNYDKKELSQPIN